MRIAVRWLVVALLGLICASILLVLSLRWVDPPTSAFMLRDRIESLRSGRGGEPVRYRWVDWKQISPHVALAVIAAEDQRFPEHEGFDLAAIREAWTEYRSGGRLRGASTISQQVAKNLFLWPGRSYPRKVLEAYFTVLIESLWPKRRILEVYLNIAQFADRVYGVEAASNALWARSAIDLSRSEAATLAAVLPNPIKLDAARPSRYVRARRQWILSQMARLGGARYLDRL